MLLFNSKALNGKKLKVKEEEMAIQKRSQSDCRPLSRSLRISCVVVFFIAVVTGTLFIPFVYESQTLWYKIGVDKTMLRAGEIAGLLAVILLFLQILLGVRGNFLQELFGIPSLIRWHRLNGLFILVLVLSHVTFVLLPEGILNLPFGVKYWPEMVGELLFLVVISMVLSSWFRQNLGFDYIRWRTVHKLLGHCAPVLVVIHVLFVSESFESGLPRAGLLVAVVAVTIAVFRAKIDAFRKKWRNPK